MKQVYVFLLLLLTGFMYVPHAGAQTWQWATGNDASYEGVVEAAPTTCDIFGNAYCAGMMFLADSISFGTHKVIDSGGYEQMVIVKTDPLGNVLWLAHTSQSFSTPVALVTDAGGALYVLGLYYDTSCIIGPFTLHNPGTSMYFLAKYSVAGDVVWAQNLVAAGNPTAIAGGIGIDDRNYIYTTGAFRDSAVTIGTTTLINTTPVGDSSDIFAARFDSGGHLLWATSFGGHSDDHSVGISVLGSGTFYIAGDFTSQTMAIGSTTLTDSSFYPGAGVPYQYPFIARFDQLGTPEWAKDMYRHTQVSSIKADGAGHVTVAGSIDSTRILGIDTLVVQDGKCSFIAQYSDIGDLTWANAARALHYAQTYALDIDSCGNTWVCGLTDSSMIFDGQVVSKPVVHADMLFLAAYDHCGRYITGSGTILPSGGDDGIGIALDNNGSIYVGGDYENIPLVLGPVTLPAPPPVREFLFLAKYTYGPMPCDHNPCCFAQPMANFTDTGTGAGTINFYYTGTGAYDSLMWDFGDGTTTNITNPIHTYTATSTSFQVCLIIYSSACGNDTICKMTEITTGIPGGTANSADVVIYPNPATGQYTIFSTAGLPAGSRAELYDLTGRLAGTYPLATHKTTIFIAGMAPGIYQYRILTGDIVVARKQLEIR